MNREYRRKLQKKNNHRLKNVDKNKRFSKCADGIVELFNSWIIASGLTKELFCDCLNDDFNIGYIENDIEVSCQLYSAEKQIGVPFVTNTLSQNDVNNFKTDLALVLLHITSLTDNNNVIKYINKFVRDNRLMV